MFRSWRSTLRVTREETRLLVTHPQGDLLKARFDTTPSHPRALLTLLEGLSLWSGEPLCVALSVDENCHGLPESRLFGNELWPAESQLVRFDIAHHDRPRRSLRGLGDFRAMRRPGGSP